jgi:hypothetical protein
MPVVIKYYYGAMPPYSSLDYGITNYDNHRLDIIYELERMKLHLPTDIRYTLIEEYLNAAYDRVVEHTPEVLPGNMAKMTTRVEEIVVLTRTISERVLKGGQNENMYYV